MEYKERGEKPTRIEPTRTMQESYGTDAERRLGVKDKRVGVRLAAPEYARFQQVLEHNRIQPAVWVRQAVTHMVVEARASNLEPLRAEFTGFRREVKSFGATVVLVTLRAQRPIIDEFTKLLSRLGPSVTASLGVRWALWVHGATVLARPGKAALYAAYDDLQRRIYSGEERPPETQVKLVTGYISQKDLT